MKLLFLSVIVLILSSSILMAETTGTITGKVIDAVSREALGGVNVVVEGTTFGASTGLDGNYVIAGLATGTYRLEFYYVGYATEKRTDIIVVPNKPAVVNVELQEEVFESEKITVTAGYFVEEKMTQPSVIGLSREEIRRFPGGFEDVVRTVSTLPGVAVNITGGRNDLLVRGGGPSENLYIINNIEVPNINHFGTQGTGSGSLSFVNLDFVENVTFSTGGFGARYGDKMSSVLSLDMARGRTDKFGSKFMVSASQYGMNLEGPINGKGSYIFSARQSYLDLIFKAAGLPFVPIYTDFNFLVNYDFTEKDRLFVLGLGAIDRVERDQASDENRVFNSGIMDNTQNQWITGINYRRLLNRGYLDLTLNLNYNQFRFSQQDENEAEYFRSRADESEIITKIQHYRALSKRIGWKSGLSAKSVTNTNTITFADTIYDRSGNRIPAGLLGLDPELRVTKSALKHALFTELDWLANNHLTINAGLRLDYFTFLDDAAYIAPRATLKYQFNKHVSVKASTGIYYQSPSYVWLVNADNKKLKALKNVMNIIGMDYMFRDDLRMTFETFYKDYSDLPTGTIPGVNDYLVLTNTGIGFGGREDDFQSFGYFDLVSAGYGRAYGFEWLLQKKFSETPFYGQISLTYGKSDYTAGNGKEYPGQYDQRFIFNITGGYKINGRWEFSTKYRLFSGIPYTPVYRPQDNPIKPGLIQNLPEEYLTKRLPVQGIFDFRIDRYFAFDTWRLITFLDIQNAFNTDIQVPPRYNFWDDEIDNINGIAILPSIGISVEF